MATTTVTGTWLTPTNQPAVGRVTFRLIAATYHDGLDAIFPTVTESVVLDENGSVSIELEPTSGVDADFDATDMTYQVTEKIKGADRAVYYVDIPTAPGVDLGALATYDDPPTIAREFVTPDLSTLGFASDTELAAANAAWAAAVAAEAVTRGAADTATNATATAQNAIWHATLDSFFTVTDPAYAGVGDGTADDADAFDAAIAATQSGSFGVTGAILCIPAGQYRLTRTVDFTRFAGQVVGAGQGNSPAYTSGAGNGSAITWDGNNTTPMFKVLDSQNIKFSQLRFEGKDTSKPTYGIEFNNAGGTAGTNQSCVVEDCYFGRYPWTTQGTNKGLITNGIGFTGTDGNNDQFRINRCTFSRHTGIGINIPNGQSVWGSIDDCVFDTCAYGIQTSASVQGRNWQFNASTTADIQINSTARVTVSGFNTETPKKVADITGLGFLTIHGGYWLLSGVGGMAAGGDVISVPGCTAGAGVQIIGVRGSVSGLSPVPIFNFAATGGGGATNPGIATFIDTFSDPLMYSFTTAIPGDSIRVFVKCGELTVDAVFNYETALVSSPRLQLGGAGKPQIRSGSGSPEGSKVAPVGSTYHRTDGGAATTLYVKESGTGNTGWVGK